MSDSLQPYGLQRARLPCPSLSLRVCFYTHVHWVDDAIQPSHPLSLPSPPALNLPSIMVFSSELALHIRWPKYWSFSISPSNEHSGLISFRTDWFNLGVVSTSAQSLHSFWSYLFTLFHQHFGHLLTWGGHLSDIFSLFILFIGFLRQWMFIRFLRFWSDLPFLSPVKYILIFHFWNLLIKAKQHWMSF